MKNQIKTFVLEENGAVSADWVVLTAGVVALAMGATGVLMDGLKNASGDIEEHMTTTTINTSF